VGTEPNENLTRYVRFEGGRREGPSQALSVGVSSNPSVPISVFSTQFLRALAVGWSTNGPSSHSSDPHWHNKTLRRPLTAHKSTDKQPYLYGDLT